MGSVKSINTENFSFTITGVNAEGMNLLTIKPLSAAAKDFFRFKKFGRKYETQMTRGEIFDFADAYEGKVLALAAI